MKLEDEKQKKKSGIGKMIYRFILYTIVYGFGTVAAFAAVVLAFGTVGYIRTKSLYDEANEKYVSIVPDNSKIVDVSFDDNANTSKSKSEESDSVSADSVSKNEPEVKVDRRSVGEIQVDIKGLKEVNPEVIGWIYFEDGLISYPILFSGDNETYLKTNYKGKYMASGSIFLDKLGTPDFSDHYTVIHGHNMRDLTMFGRLRYYRKNGDYVKDHGYFHVITEDNDYRYKIFSSTRVDSMGLVYSVIPDGNDGLASFTKAYLLPGSSVKTDVTVQDSDHVIALSTCINDYKFRFIVCGVRVN